MMTAILVMAALLIGGLVGIGISYAFGRWVYRTAQQDPGMHEVRQVLQLTSSKIPTAEALDEDAVLGADGVWYLLKYPLGQTEESMTQQALCQVMMRYLSAKDIEQVLLLEGIEAPAARAASILDIDGVLQADEAVRAALGK